MNAEKSLMEELYASTLKDIKEGEVSKGSHCRDNRQRGHR